MPKQSILQNKEAVSQAIINSSSVKDCLRILGLRSAGGNYTAFYKSCERFNLTPPKADAYKTTANAIMANTIPLEEILIQNSLYSNRTYLKKRLIDNNLLIDICSICNMLPIWEEKNLTLQLDHINGVYNDHRLENLRLVCPNCHSQTDTFCGRRKQYEK